MLTEEDTINALEMTDDRNLTAHTYHEEVAEEIYRKIGGYYVLMNNMYQLLTIPSPSCPINTIYFR